MPAKNKSKTRASKATKTTKASKTVSAPDSRKTTNVVNPVLPEKAIEVFKDFSTVKATESHKELPKEAGSIPIAVVGVGALFPGSTEVGGYWRDILAGNNFVTEVPPTHFFIEDCYNPDPFAPDSTYCKTGAFLSPVEFDPMEYGIPPNNIPTTDTSQLLALIVAKQVLEDAFKGQFSNINRDRISVVLGVAAGLELLGEMACRLGRPVWVKSLREEGIPENKVQEICNRISSHYTEWKESTFPGLLGNVVAGRIANYFDLGGVNCTSDSACASSFSALGMAINELRMGKSDVVITGGVDTNNDPFLFISFSKTPALSPTHDCRPFSDKADGMVLGEGIGMVALKRLSDAERDGDRIYAVIKGVGASSDGRGTSIYSPVAKGQAKALRRAYEDAGYSPATVELVEAHGTGTRVGDTTEFQGLCMVYNDAGRKDSQWCALGSVKSQIGHTKSTAAAAGLIKAIMAVHHKILPPTIKVERPDPKLEIEKSPFYLNTKARPWVRDDAYPRRASISSFGFGGTNWHVTIEEYKGSGTKAYRLRTVPNELIMFSAKSSNELLTLCKETAKDLSVKGLLAYLAKTTQEQFDVKLPQRLAIVATDEADLEKKLKTAIDKISSKPAENFEIPSGVYYAANNVNTGSIAFLFPGQGSQYVGMGADLAMHFEEIQEIWDVVANIPRDDGELEACLKHEGDVTTKSDPNNSEQLERLCDIVFPKPVFSDDDRKKQSDTLMATQWSQPAILTVSLTMSHLLQNMGVKPDCVAGHSLGEITSLFEAGALDCFSLLRVCRKRSQLMAKAALNPGSMTAVVIPADRMNAILKELKSDVIIANHNSPTQIVLSGPTPSIEEIEQRLKAEKIKFKRLPVPAAFHSSMMSESCKPFLEYLEIVDFNSPSLPVYSNVEGKPHSNDVGMIRKLIAKQLNHPVRFFEQIEHMYSSGVRTFIEVGPSSVLTNLVAQCLEGKPYLAVNLDHKNEHGTTSLWKALGKLSVSGIPLDFSYLWKHFAPVSDPRQKKKPKISISLLGCNYGRPYPPPEGRAALPQPNPVGAKFPETTTVSIEKTPVHAKTSTMKPEKETKGSADMEKTTVYSSTHQGTAAKTLTQDIKQPKSVDRIDAPAQHQSVAPAPSKLSLQNKSGQPFVPSVKNQMQDAGSGEMNRDDYDAWVRAYQEVQRQTAEIHASYQKTMADSHLAFLNTAEASTLTLSGMITGRHMAARGEVYKIETERISAPFTTQSGQGQEAAIGRSQAQSGFDQNQYAASKPLPGLTEVQTNKPAISAPKPLGAAPLIPIKDSSPAKALTGQEDPAVSGQVCAPAKVDFKEMLMRVVADKTGYPKEILSEDMGLESDLGIDSIKRVEILSAVKEESPWLPEVDPAEMASIETLGDVISYIEKIAPPAPETAHLAGSHSQSPAPGAKVAAQASSTAMPEGINLKELLMSVVADKTGYPKEILTEDMGLESDLGIDSIKRVEILSAVKEESPWLPEVDPAEMASIETLGDVIRYIQTLSPSAPASVTVPAPAIDSLRPVTGIVPEGIDFKEMLMRIVAEKTGYPKDILTEDMGLESDLGIDSIKRVEILSAVKDESPWLPEVDPGEMADIVTLGDVISYIRKVAPSVTSPGAGTSQPSVSPPVTVGSIPAPGVEIPEGVNLKDMLMSIVAEKTGYPKDILTEEMGLESDLGIDSIKRVEILSAVKDESPWLPEVDPGEMADIVTLGDVIKYLEKVAPGKKGEPVHGVSEIDSHAHAADSASEGFNDEKTLKVGRYALREVSAPHSGFSMKGLDSGHLIAVTDDKTGVSQALVRKMKERGVNAEVVDEIPDTAGGLVFLGGLKKIAKKEEAMAVNREAFLAANKVAKKLSESGGMFVTVQDTGGDFGLSGKSAHRVWLGGLPGLVKTAAIEWSEASVKAIDINRGKKSADAVAEAIIRELYTGGPEIEVGIHSNGDRFRLDSFPEALKPAEPVVDKKSVIVASGGARGVTARTLIELAKDTQCSFVLLGRTPLTEEPVICRGAMNDSDLKRVLMEDAKSHNRKVTPAELGAQSRKILANREIHSTLNALEASGSRARYVVADVQEASSVSAALKPIRKEWGPITGIVHGAGVLTDKLIVEKKPEQFDLVFNTKVRGLQSLLTATDKDPIKIICFFSSVAARFGNMGQCDYAMANEVLNKVGNAEAVRRKGTCRVKSINWGPWDGGMVSPLLKAHFKEIGIPLIPFDAGARNFVEEIQEGSPEYVEIVIGPAPPKGGLSIRSQETPEMRLQLLINNNNFPYIDSHRIQDKPVVPVAMVLEWFSRAACLHTPSLAFSACKDLKVLKGIKIEEFQESSGKRLNLNCRLVSNKDGAVLNLELPGDNGLPLYSATVEMVEAIPHKGKAFDERESKKEMQPWDLDFDKIYSEQLFHGPDFQVIRSLEGVSETAASAIIAGTREMNWPGDFWKTDAAAIDGGLQLAILWGIHNSGKKSLPTKIGAYHSYHDGLLNGPIRCELYGQMIGNDRSISDILFFDEENNPVAEMRGVEMHMLPESSSK